MPNLDGISATSLIRQFDELTPIISVTSNSLPSEILTYYSSGMNDVLPKPFTRDGVFNILEVRFMSFMQHKVSVLIIFFFPETPRTLENDARDVYTFFTAHH